MKIDDIIENNLWIPLSTKGFSYRPILFDLRGGRFSIVFKGLPGCIFPKHYHTGQVQGYTIQGIWFYIENSWKAHPGSFVFEAAGDEHTMMVDVDSPCPAIVMFHVEGGLLFTENSENDVLLADAHTLLKNCEEYFTETQQSGMEHVIILR